MNRKRTINISSRGLKQVVSNFLSINLPLPKYLNVSEILAMKNIPNSIIHSEKDKLTREINIISLLRWLCEDLNNIPSPSCYEKKGYKFAILIFRLHEINLFDQIVKSESMTKLYQKIQRDTSKPYRMSFQIIAQNNSTIGSQIDQKQSDKLYLSILHKQRSRSNEAAIECFRGIQEDCYQLVSMESRFIAKDILLSCRGIENQSINFTNIGKGLKIIVANLALNLRRQLRKETFIKEIQCEQCRSKIQFRLYLLSALILPHSLEQFKQVSVRNPKIRSPLQYFNQPSCITQLHLYLLEVGSNQLSRQKAFLSSLVSPKDK